MLGLRVGGLERVVVNLARGLHGPQWRVVVICLEEGGEFVTELEQSGIVVHVIHKKPGVDWTAIRRLAQLLRQENAAIVHTHNPAPHFHGVMASMLASFPIRVHTKHGRNYPDDPKKVRVNRVLSWLTDAIVPVSDNACDVALQIEHVNPRKIHRIWNGVDTELYCPNAHHSALNALSAEALAKADLHPAIGTVARLSPEKDQKTMLAAFRLVANEIRDARLVFVGDGPCMAELRDTAVKLGIGDRVDFLGQRSDIPAVLNTFSLFTLTSTTEGISMTILEAMATGLPVVATDAGGNREIVNPPECGVIVPVGDPRALADAYLALLRDPVQRAQMGVVARARMVGYFSLQQMTRQYTELYTELLHLN